jgi:tellurite methyltransferase
MSLEERVLWDEHYRKQQGTRDYPAPDPLLFEFVPPPFDRRPHYALDAACGYGQNALWMASQGYTVDAVDISRVALAVGQVRSAKLNLRNVNLLPHDLDEHEFTPNTYDVVVVARFIKRGLMPHLRAATRPGGRIIYLNPNTVYLHQNPDYDPEQLFRVGELMGYFADWNIIHNSSINGMSQLVAVKPSADGR